MTKRRKKAADPTTAVAYIRVSTNATRQALSIRAQARAIRDWSRKAGIRIVRWRVETVSGGATLDKRLRLVRAIADVSVLGAGQLVVAKLDRFSRDPLTAALAESELRRTGASIAIADGNGSGDDPTAQLVRDILLSVARFEKAMIRARIKAALQVKKARGEMTGAAPYGFRLGADGKTLVQDRGEQATLRYVRALAADGLSIRRIIQAAADAGHLSRAGKPFTVSAMHAMVKGSPTS